MKIAIIGANGKIGRIVTRVALERNHSVVAVVRNEMDVAIDDAITAVSVIEGDATNYNDMLTALDTCDAVISVIGHSAATPVDMQARSMQSVSSVMTKLGIERLISLTGNGVLVPGDSPSIIDRALTAVLLFLDPKRVQDGIRHLQVLEGSNIDWVVLRTPKHVNGQKKGQGYVKRDNVQGASMFISRQAIAATLLELAEAEVIKTRTPVISNK